MLDADTWFAHAIYRDTEHASKAVRQLIEAHFTSDAIGVLMVRGNEVEELPMKHKTFVPHGVALGALFGAAAGAVTMSGIGLLAAGPLLLALQGAAAGTAIGSVGGALGGLGFWRDEVDFPSDAFEQGAVLVGVVTNPERLDDAQRVLKLSGADETYVATKAEAGQRAVELSHSHRPRATAVGPH
ncbi:MAG: hypothetical protein RL701_7881 [Pseudomonadota bacterium]|jgi:hypothetical protein